MSGWIWQVHFPTRPHWRALGSGGDGIRKRYDRQYDLSKCSVQGEKELHRSGICEPAAVDSKHDPQVQ